SHFFSTLQLLGRYGDNAAPPPARNVGAPGVTRAAMQGQRRPRRLVPTPRAARQRRPLAPSDPHRLHARPRLGSRHHSTQTVTITLPSKGVPSHKSTLTALVAGGSQPGHALARAHHQGAPSPPASHRVGAKRSSHGFATRRSS